MSQPDIHLPNFIKFLIKEFELAGCHQVKYGDMLHMLYVVTDRVCWISRYSIIKLVDVIHGVGGSHFIRFDEWYNVFNLLSIQLLKQAVF